MFHFSIIDNYLSIFDYHKVFFELYWLKFLFYFFWRFLIDKGYIHNPRVVLLVIKIGFVLLNYLFYLPDIPSSNQSKFIWFMVLQYEYMTEWSDWIYRSIFCMYNSILFFLLCLKCQRICFPMISFNLNYLF